MSDVWTPEERARRLAAQRLLLATPKPDRTDTLAKRGGAIGCLLLMALLVLGFAGLVLWVWRKAIAG